MKGNTPASGFRPAVSRRMLLAGALAAPAIGRAATSMRLVSVGAYITETIFALGMEEALVAVDMRSTYPGTVRRLPVIGGPRELAVEPILSMRPTHVIAAGYAAPQSALQAVRSTGVAVEVLDETHSVPALCERVLRIGSIVGKAFQAASLTDAIRADLEIVTRQLPDRKPAVAYVLSVQGGAPVLAGRNTAAHAMIALAGGRNIGEGHDGYKPVGPEALLATAPDVVLVRQEHAELSGGLEALRRHPALAGTPAAEAGRLHTMDSLYLLGFGPRLAHAAADLASFIHGLEVRRPPDRDWVGDAWTRALPGGP